LTPAYSSMDVLAVGAHPDDVELGIGGTLHKLAQRGFAVGILDLTRGEMSTRGNIEERALEAANAAHVLGVARRENAGIPDSAVANSKDMQLTVIPFIRSFRPKTLIIPMLNDRHPDHAAAYHLMRDAAYFAGLVKIETGQEPFRPQYIYYYHPYYESAAAPQLVVDITGSFDAKLAALRTHATQFFNPGNPGPRTYISSEAFWENIRVRAAYWGSRIGVAYGEPLYFDGPIGVAVPPGLAETRLAETRLGETA
jgi:bacillithiol biosynthesis deacetylase BshB1